MSFTEIQKSLIKRTRILIVDDLPENLQLLGSSLREQGFQIAFATNGMQALKIAELKKPALILLDMSMPEMDGIAVIKKLKENPQTKDIIVLFVTARTDSETIMKALSLGAADYIAKPFSSADLIQRIMNHLKISKTINLETEEEKDFIYSKTISILEKEFLPKLDEIKSSMFIDEIADFARNITVLGNQNRVSELSEYGQILLENTEALKVERITELLNQFPTVVKKIIEKR